MLRNREIQLFLITLAVISFLSITTAFVFLSIQAVIVISVTVLALLLSFLLFTSWRYREIEKLSSYLRQISNGDYSLDVRDNYEGELSILKSNIYKVTLMLSEQGSLLQQDKIKLTNAISDISHQLKTPLTSMMVMADLLRNAELNEDKRAEFTRNIRDQLERIEWLVSSLLKLSKIDAGTAVFKREKVYVHELVERAIEPLLIPMDIKQQTLNVVGAESVSFIGDMNWTTEAMINILKNCVEHTGVEGVINIAYSENALYTEITIVDNGKGIPKEDVPHIFKRFYKGKTSGEDSVGIGLAMAYSIITSQQGDIHVTSEVGHGTKFQIKLYKQVI
ncbi:HAMP domain-containing histidine kinase [Aquibacillus koreensis]|uniref:histidine kinase n=1 Tax=Aquibacillus koreensis TaxID=279446 RepID=A0A9X3WT34_9BACI|nr:HAMP domain-containing sensor histidine kinase [Aquibacillus koreensis]MCT2535239.1 HAMP domain-containing histidine kinase [Aquibacillus koreensis]MDC3422854.1 HAMP domain-containing histidine kinase [Aquibacillus koreensis]